MCHITQPNRMPVVGRPPLLWAVAARWSAHHISSPACVGCLWTVPSKPSRSREAGKRVSCCHRKGGGGMGQPYLCIASAGLLGVLGADTLTCKGMPCSCTWILFELRQHASTCAAAPPPSHRRMPTGPMGDIRLVHGPFMAAARLFAWPWGQPLPHLCEHEPMYLILSHMRVCVLSGGKSSTQRMLATVHCAI